MYKVKNIFDCKHWFEYIANDVRIYADPFIPVKDHKYSKQEYIDSWNCIEILLQLLWKCHTKEDIITLIQKQLNDSETKNYTLVQDTLNKFLKDTNFDEFNGKE